MIQEGHPIYAKRYMTTLKGLLRKDFELYRAAKYLKESDAISQLVQKGLEHEKEISIRNEIIRKQEREKLK